MRLPSPRRAGVALALFLPFLAACGGKTAGSSLGQSPAVPDLPSPTATSDASAVISIGPSKIKHVVFMIQENRSFDYIFGGLDDNGNPFPGADTVSNPIAGEPTPHNHLGQAVQMQTGLLEECYMPNHDRPNAVTELNKNKMNGFDKESVQKLPCASQPVPKDYVYRFVNYNEVVPYWQMGEQYAISDRMFQSTTSASFSAHLYYVAGQSSRAIDNPSNTPWGCDAPIGTKVPVYNEKTGGEIASLYPCFEMPTLADEMDARKVSWRWYGMPNTDFGYFWQAYDAIRQIRLGPDWTTNIVTPSAQIITDVGNGSLASMTWVTPSEATSDHPMSTSNKGPAWIASVVDAIGASQFWDSTAIFISWDDWGGWYDHVPPPKWNEVGYGLRIPLIIVSPYAKPGYVSHVVHSAGSLVRFTEEIFGLPSLGELDSKSDDMGDAFNFTQSPTVFQPFVMKQSLMDEARRAATVARPLQPGVSPDD